MSTHQLQEYGRTRKQLELTYIKERKQLEDYMKSNVNRKKGKNKKPSRLADLGI